MTRQEVKEEIAARMYYEKHPLGSWEGTTLRNKIIARKSAEYIFSIFKQAGYVQLDPDQSLPEPTYGHIRQFTYKEVAEDIFKQDWRKVKKEDL